MFDGLKRLWRGIVKMFDYTTVKNVIGYLHCQALF